MTGILHNNFRGGILHNNFRGDVLHNNFSCAVGDDILPDVQPEKKTPSKTFMIIGGLVILAFIAYPSFIK